MLLLGDANQDAAEDFPLPLPKCVPPETPVLALYLLLVDQTYSERLHVLPCLTREISPWFSPALLFSKPLTTK